MGDNYKLITAFILSCHHAIVQKKNIAFNNMHVYIRVNKQLGATKEPVLR